MMKGGQESHRGCSCSSGSLVPKGKSLAGPGVQDEPVSPEYQQQETKGHSPGRGSDMVQMPQLSGEKLHSLHFQIPGKDGLTLPTEEEVMLLKDTRVLLGRACTDCGQTRAPDIHPAALGNGFPSGPSGKDYFSWNSFL